MSDAEKPSNRAANDNPWYCLATLHGEQPIDAYDRDLAEKNRGAWNRWIGDLTEGERADFVPLFARRTSGKAIMLPERAGIPNLSHTHFDRRASFKGFVFAPGADFISSTFSEVADFSRAVFSDMTNFESVSFAKMADFEGARFNNIVSFDSATFSDVAHFASTTFGHAAHFDNATFSDGADFNAATFAGLIAFNSATFCSATDFSSAALSGPADFVSTTFEREIHFVNAKLAGVTWFSDARFKRRVPDFRGATLHEATEWHGVTWPKPPESKRAAQQQVYAYERLKQEMERLKKHEDEQNFFRRELRARRSLAAIPSGSWLLNAAYQVTSDYGNSFGRPLLWLFAVFASGIAIFAHVPLCAGKPMPFKLAARLSFANIFVFLPDKRELMTTTEMGFCLSNWTAAVSAIQSILGFVLLFLFGLALRNRFRMK